MLIGQQTLCSKFALVINKLNKDHEENTKTYVYKLIQVQHKFGI